MKTLGSGLTSVGKGLTEAVTLPIVGIGAAALESYNNVNKAYANIRAATGQTGQSLTNLQGMFKDLASQVPNSFNDVSKAISTVFDRLSQGGYNVEDISHKILDVSRMTGESIDGLSDKFTAAIKQWGVSAGDASGFMDTIWKSTEQGRISVTKFLTDLDSYGPTLRAAFEATGDSAQTALARVIPILGGMESKGEDVTRSVQGLAYGWANLAKTMEAPSKTTQAAVDAVTASMKAAGVQGDTTADQMQGLIYGIQHGMVTDGEASQLFGARFSANIVQEIKEGALTADDFKKQLDSNTDSINKAGKDTITFAQSLDIMKNKLELALAPLGQDIATSIQSQYGAINQLIGGIGSLVSAFDRLSPTEKEAIIGIAAVAAVAGPAAIALGSLFSAIGNIQSGFAKIISVISPSKSAIADVGAASSTSAAQVTTLGGAEDEATISAGKLAAADTTAATSVEGVGTAAVTADGELTTLTGAATGAGGAMTGLATEASVATGGLGEAGLTGAVAGAGGAMGGLETGATDASGAVAGLDTEAATAAGGGGALAAAGVLAVGLAAIAGAALLIKKNADDAKSSLQNLSNTPVSPASATSSSEGYPPSEPQKPAVASASSLLAASQGGPQDVTLQSALARQAQIQQQYAYSPNSPNWMVSGYFQGQPMYQMKPQAITAMNQAEEAAGANDIQYTPGGAPYWADKGTYATQASAAGLAQLKQQHPEYFQKGGPFYTPTSTASPTPTSHVTGSTISTGEKGGAPGSTVAMAGLGGGVLGLGLQAGQMLSGVNWGGVGDFFKGVGKNLGGLNFGNIGNVFSGFDKDLGNIKFPDLGKSFAGLANIKLPDFGSFKLPSVQDILGKINIPAFGGWHIPSISDILGILHIPGFNWSIPSIGDIINKIGGFIDHLGWNIPSVGDVVGKIGSYIDQLHWSIPSAEDVKNKIGSYVDQLHWSLPSAADIRDKVGSYVDQLHWSIPSASDVLGKIGSAIPTLNWSLPSASDILGQIAAKVTGTGGIFGQASSWIHTAESAAAQTLKKGETLAGNVAKALGLPTASGGTFGLAGIPGLAEGSSIWGTTTGPQLRWVGEAGPEAIVPQKYFWALPPWLFDVLPKLGGGSVAIPSSPVNDVNSILDSIVKGSFGGGGGSQSHETHYHIDNVVVDSEDMVRRSLMAFRRLEDYRHLTWGLR